ncbi:RNA-dependent RNA polymerase 1 [Bienertia sinuspersici]
MGDFREIKNVAKNAVRLSQSFSLFKESLTIPREESELIHDVKVLNGRNTYIFSDGIRKISTDFACKVARVYGYSSTPFDFQIRYGGFKGGVVNPKSFKKLSLRGSMCKYKSENDKLDVLEYNKYSPCYVNHQLSTLLFTFGVEYHVFEKKQKEALNLFDAILKDPLKAQEASKHMCPGESYKLNQGYLSHVEDMIGNDLLTLTDNDFEPNNYVVKGKVVMAKNPCLHPSDFCILMAVDVPALHHMIDCVVFPQRGKRPHPNECSKSDLDGLYLGTLSWFHVTKRNLWITLQLKKVMDYYANYIINDGLGIIANAHTAFANKEPRTAMSDPYIKLARVFLIVVDFPQNWCSKYPDFLDKPDKPIYESYNIIGKLIRKVTESSPSLVQPPLNHKPKNCCALL